MTDKLLKNIICYHGKVELFVCDEKTTVHNEGLVGLSELFTRSLLGYPTENYKPKYLDLRDSNDISVLFGLVELRAGSFDFYKDDNDPSEYDGWTYPVFDALILSENLSDINYDNKKAEGEPRGHYLYLLGGNKTPIAKVLIDIVDTNGVPTIDGRPQLIVRGGNNILVRWSMYLSNRVSEEE